MKKRIILAALIGLTTLLLTACSEKEPEILPSYAISAGELSFDVPKGFIIDEKRTDETITYYESELNEFSKVIYKKLENDGSFHSLSAETSISAIKEYAKETYLAKTRPELDLEEHLEINGRAAYKYIISYNLYDAPMTHFHCYIEDGEIIHHLEYISVEEEGYSPSFALYFDSIRFE